MPALLPRVWEAWRPPPVVRAVDWIPQHVVIPSETESPGPFDLDLFPHVRDVLEAIDDPAVRRILMRWAARNAKTTTALAALLFLCSEMPRPGLFASSNEERSNDTIASQLYPMAEACDVTRPYLPPVHRRAPKAGVQLGRARIRRGYSGSASTMAGFPACYGVASEVSKWSKNRSGEADPIYLFSQRAKLYPFDSKLIFEGTPGTIGRCNITTLMEGEGVDRRWRWVPCPHCGEFQRLVFGGRDPNEPGIKWPKDKHGKCEPARAESEGWYRCVKGCRVENEDRPQMMRAGVWLSAGQRVTKSGRVTGDRPETGVVGFDELSSLYSLVISGWGQIAREWLEAQGNHEAIRDFQNSTLAQVFDPKPRNVKPEEVAQRMCGALQRGLCPPWTVFLTLGVDSQQSATEFPWALCAWGAGGRGHKLAHGVESGFDGVKALLDRPWPQQDAGRSLLPSLALIDSGNDRDEVYRFCWENPRAKPCKGMAAAFDALYREAPIERIPGMELIHVNTHASQTWLQRLIDGQTPPDHPAFFSIAAEDAFDLDLLDQLLNEVCIKDVDDKGYPTERWERRNRGIPNDLRDAIRYAWTAAQLLTRNGVLWSRLPASPVLVHGTPASCPALISEGIRRPDGRPW